EPLLDVPKNPPTNRFLKLPVDKLHYYEWWKEFSGCEVTLDDRPCKLYGDIENWDTKQLSINQFKETLVTHLCAFWNQQFPADPIQRVDVLLKGRINPNSKASLHFVVDRFRFNKPCLKYIALAFIAWLKTQPPCYFTQCMTDALAGIFDQKVYQKNHSFRMLG